MNTGRMTTPDSRAEFEHNLFLLGERITQGKMFFMAGIRLDDFLRVRKLPNGRVDLLSVDESTRLTANTCANTPQPVLPPIPAPVTDPLADTQASAEKVPPTSDLQGGV
jgi:hypothetical protein